MHIDDVQFSVGLGVSLSTFQPEAAFLTLPITCHRPTAEAPNTSSGEKRTPSRVVHPNLRANRNARRGGGEGGGGRGSGGGGTGVGERAIAGGVLPRGPDCVGSRR